MNIVIIGGVACGPKTASRIKRLNPKAKVTIIEQGELVSYAGCGLPFYLAGEVKEKNELMTTGTGVIRDETYFELVKDINVITSCRCTQINRQNKEVELLDIKTNEKSKMTYDKLVLATGGEAVFPNIPGIDLPGIYKLTHPDEAEQILAELKTKKVNSVVIVGAGLIGLETAEAISAHGIKVTIVEREEYALPSMYDLDIGTYLTNYINSQEINFLSNDNVISFEGNEDNNLARVHTDNTIIEAQVAIIAAGTKANVKLAQEAGLKITKQNTIEVNKYLATSLDNDIYAGGDCVANLDRLTNKNVFAPMGSTANKHGRVIANNICGLEEKFPGVMSTSICRIFDYNVARTGLTEKNAIAKGYDCISVLIPGSDKPHFLEAAQDIIVKLIIDKNDRKILGAQIVGPGDVFSRINIIVTGMSFGMTVDDLANLDLAYAPPFAPAMDNVIVAGNVARNKLDGLAEACTPIEVKNKLNNKEDFIFLDVRSKEEQKIMYLPYDNVVSIPLGILRHKANDLPKNKETIIFCRVGSRGYEAQTILKGLGFTDVKFLDGGLSTWPYEIESLGV